MTVGKSISVCLVILLIVALSALSAMAQVPSGTRYVFTDTPDELAAPGTPQYTRAIAARLQNGGLRKLEDFLRDDGFSSGGTRPCFSGPADCYRRMDVCLNYDIKFNYRSNLRFRSDVGPNGALQVDLAIKRPHNTNPPYDLNNLSIQLSNPTSFSWCFFNPLRSFSGGRIKFSEDGSTPGLEVNLLLEPVLQGGNLSVRKVGGFGVRINRMFLQASGWPDFLINFIFNLGFVRSSISSMIETQTISVINTYLRDLFRFQGGFEGFSYSFLPSRARIDGSGMTLGFNGGVSYLGVEDACTMGRAPWPTEPGTNPASTLESFHSDKDVGIGIRTVLADNALREAYTRGTFCYKNDASPFRIGDFCSAAPQLCELFNPQAEAYFDVKLLPYDPGDPSYLPRVEITRPGPDGRLAVHFNGLNLQAFLRDQDTPDWQKLLCLYVDATIEANVVFSGSAVFLRLGGGGTTIDNYFGSLMPKDITTCTGGLDITALLPPETIEGLIRDFLIPFFNNTVGQIPFSTNIFSFGCYRVFANGYGLGGEYANIYASFLRAASLPSCGAAGGRTTVDIFNGPAEGSRTNNKRPSFWARAADPRGETACVDMRYASGFDGSPGAYVAAGGCPLGIYMTQPATDLPDGDHVFRIQAKTLAVPRDPVCLPSGRPECESVIVERRFIVDTTPPTPPQVTCPADTGAATVTVAWDPAGDAMTAKEDIRYLWFLEDRRDGSREQSAELLSDAERYLVMGPGSGAGSRPLLQPGTAYDFWVKAVDQAGNVSAESNRCRFAAH